MRRNIIRATALGMAMMLAVAAKAQGFTTLGVGIDNPIGTLHVHSAVEYEDVFPFDPNPTLVVGDATQQGGTAETNSLLISDGFLHNHRTVFHMSNPNTGANGGGGFIIEQMNRDITMRQSEDAHITIAGHGGSRLIFSRTGVIGIGSVENNYGFNVGVTSRFEKRVELLRGLYALGGVEADSLMAGSGFSVKGAQTTCNSLKVNASQQVAHNLTVQQNTSVGGKLAVGGTMTVGSGFSCDADGNMKVKHLRVTETDWPDYVFGEGYRLMPLAEVERYIGANGHLPEAPAAAEVESEGVDQGELNRLLMQKVEELTLYVIELQKQIEELKK